MKHFLLLLLLAVGQAPSVGGDCPLVPILEPVRPAPSMRPPTKAIRWDLVVFDHLLNDCLDTTRVLWWQHTWHYMHTRTSAYFAFQRLRNNVLIEQNGKATLYERTQTGKATKRAEGLVRPDSFLFETTGLPGDIYEEKVIKRTDRYLVLSHKPGSLNIYFNRVNPPDSLTAADCYFLMWQTGQRFRQPIPVCK